MGMYRRIALGVGACVLVAAVAFAAWYVYKPARPYVDIPTGPTFVYAAGNFSISIPDGWLVATTTVPLPKGFTGSRFVFTQGVCALAYAVGDGSLQTAGYKQTTPGGARGITAVGNTQIDSWWWVPAENLPKNFETAFEGRKPFAGEVRVSSATYVAPGDMPSAFLLYTKDGTPVPDSCDTAVEASFKTITPVFEQAALTAASSGVVRALTERIALNGSVLAFKETGSDEYKKITEAKNLYIPFYTVYADKLYFIEDNALKMFDVFLGTKTSVSGVGTDSNYIVSSFFIKGDRMWYLAGSQVGCDEYKAVCELSLYEIPAEGGISTLLATTTLQSGSFMGYNKTSQTLYLSSGFGDAGCFSTQVYAYRYSDKTMSLTAEDSGCDDGSPKNTTPGAAQIAAIRNTLGPAPVEATTVRISGGHITPIKDTVEHGSQNFLFPAQ